MCGQKGRVAERPYPSDCIQGRNCKCHTGSQRGVRAPLASRAEGDNTRRIERGCGRPVPRARLKRIGWGHYFTRHSPAATARLAIAASFATLQPPRREVGRDADKARVALGLLGWGRGRLQTWPRPTALLSLVPYASRDRAYILPTHLLRAANTLQDGDSRVTTGRDRQDGHHYIRKWKHAGVRTDL